MQRNNHRQSSAKITKQDLQGVAFFNYYVTSLFPTLFDGASYPPTSFSHFKATARNLSYNYVYQEYSGIEDANQESILQAAKLVYSSVPGVIAKENIYQKKTAVKLPYLPLWKEFSERLDIFVTNSSRREEHTNKRGFQSPYRMLKKSPVKLQRQRSIPLLSMNRVQGETAKQNVYLYIIHHCQQSDQNDQSLWENFAERYTFGTVESLGEKKNKVIYECIFTYNSQIKFDQTQLFLPIFFQSRIFSEKDKQKLALADKINNKVRSLVQASKTKKNIELQSPSFDPSHRRELKLTNEQKVIFENLKVKTFALFSTLNRRRQANRFILQNVICRMMGNNSYKQNDSWEAIQYYLAFEKRMREKYTWSSFQKYDKMNIFSYIGKDMMGRPILLNRLRNTLCSQIQNFDQFFDYHMYLFEIYMQDQMEGWVDQFVVIADVSNQVADNTNLGFTKRIIFEALKTTLGRPHKIIAFDIGFLGSALYRMLRPLLPTSFTDCMKVIGDDREELLSQLREEIADDNIPEFLGGKKVTLQTSQERLNTEVTSDRSNNLRSVKSMKHI